MALDRNKVARSAEKLVARGKLDAAIDEYRKLLAESANDTTTLNRVGDLYARLNRLDKAIALFIKTADHFISEGFFVKAIAIYKKIIRLDPSQIEVYEKLAELYSRQGLVNEARSQYQVVSDYYLKHDRIDAAVAVHRKLVELEPEHPGHRLRLADLLRRAGRLHEAVAQFREIASLLVAHGRIEDATKLYVTALEVDASDLDFLADALVELKGAGHQAAAERLLAAAVERNPEARTLSRLLGVDSKRARARREAPPAEEAVAPEEAAPAPPVEEPPAEEPKAAAVPSELEGEDILVLDLDDEELSSDLGPPSSELLEGGLGAEIQALGQEEIEIDLDPLSGPPFAEPALSEDELAFAERLDELMAEAETLAKFGLVEKAARRLEEVIELAPDHAQAYDPLVSLYLDRGDHGRLQALAGRLSELAAEGQVIDTWRAVRDRLREEGVEVEEEAAPVAEVEVEPPPAVAAEGAGDAAGHAGWLDEAQRDVTADELFRDEEQFFDLASELEEELRREGELAEEEELIEPLDEQSVQEIVDGFKRGMAETLSAEDYDTHYNLGIAYREMGLVDEAIGEFQLASKDPRYLVDCCSLLAASFIDKGFPELAVKWYLRGLESPTLTEEESLGLLYELGNLHLSMGDEDKARLRFVEIYGINSNYRDVVAKLEELGTAG